jgi:hypothetical protein
MNKFCVDVWFVLFICFVLIGVNHPWVIGVALALIVLSLLMVGPVVAIAQLIGDTRVAIAALPRVLQATQSIRFSPEEWALFGGVVLFSAAVVLFGLIT